MVRDVNGLGPRGALSPSLHNAAAMTRRRTVPTRVQLAGMPPRPTGLSGADAQDDFLRARRRLALARLRRGCGASPATSTTSCRSTRWSRRWAASGERDLGLPGRAARRDRRHRRPHARASTAHFRPTTPQVRARWERIAAAMRRGESMPPIDLYRIGDATSSATATTASRSPARSASTQIDARVVEVVTRVGAARDLLRADLPLKSHERVFRERVPLPPRRASPDAPERPVGFAEPRRGRSRRGAGAGPRSTASCWTASSWRAAGSRRSTCRW